MNKNLFHYEVLITHLKQHQVSWHLKILILGELARFLLDHLSNQGWIDSYYCRGIMCIYMVFLFCFNYIHDRSLTERC